MCYSTFYMFQLLGSMQAQLRVVFLLQGTWYVENVNFGSFLFVCMNDVMPVMVAILHGASYHPDLHKYTWL